MGRVKGWEMGLERGAKSSKGQRQEGEEVGDGVSVMWGGWGAG